MPELILCVFPCRESGKPKTLKNIRAELDRRGYSNPLCADVQFNPAAADIAIKYVKKVRINPGNFYDKRAKFEKLTYTDEEYRDELKKIEDRFIPFIRECKARGTALRIGANQGSLSDRIMSRYGDTPAGIVESVMEFLRICKKEEYHNIVISIKSSNTRIMVLYRPSDELPHEARGYELSFSHWGYRSRRGRRRPD